MKAHEVSACRQKNAWEHTVRDDKKETRSSERNTSRPILASAAVVAGAPVAAISPHTHTCSHPIIFSSNTLRAQFTSIRSHNFFFSLSFLMSSICLHSCERINIDQSIGSVEQQKVERRCFLPDFRGARRVGANLQQGRQRLKKERERRQDNIFIAEHRYLAGIEKPRDIFSSTYCQNAIFGWRIIFIV